MNNIVFTRNGIIKLLNALNHKKHLDQMEYLLGFWRYAQKKLQMPSFWYSLHLSSKVRYRTTGDMLSLPLCIRMETRTVPIQKTISLTSVTCKLMGHVIHSHIMKHLDRDQTLSNAQHGFRKFHSCETQLLQTVNTIRDQRQHLQMVFRLSSKPNT